MLSFLKHFAGIALRISDKVKGGSAPKSKPAFSVGFGTTEYTYVGYEIRTRQLDGVVPDVYDTAVEIRIYHAL